MKDITEIFERHKDRRIKEMYARYLFYKKKKKR